MKRIHKLNSVKPQAERIGKVFRSFRSDKDTPSAIGLRLGFGETKKSARTFVNKIERGDRLLKPKEIVPFCQEYAVLTGYITAQALVEMYLKESYPARS